MPTNDKTLNTQLAVIGAGPGGYAAAFAAADRGLEVTLIDDRPAPGGVCLNVGCIPSKALLHAAKVLSEAREAKAFGLNFGDPKIDLDALRDWKNGIIKKLTGGVGKLAKSRKVNFLQGRAVFIDSERLRIEDSATELIRFEKAIVATGSSPIIPTSLAVESDRLMDSTKALALDSMPESLLVVGGGYIGLELGIVYAELGSKVTIVEMTDGLLPGVDRDLVRPLAQRMRKVTESILLNTLVAKIQETKEGLKVSFEKQKGDEAEKLEQTFDRVLIATGRRPNTSGLLIENTRARINSRGFIETNDQRRTDDENIYAIGDVAGEPMLAHKATREGKIAAEAIAGEPVAFDPAAIPAVVFTDPEIAWCGLTEDEAKERGIEIRVSRFPWGASGRAMTLGRVDGVTKIIADAASGLVLGVGMAGPGAGELIAEGALAIELGATAEDIGATIHPHPTLSETFMESAELIFGSATHVHRKK